jgi:hypothetical protein
MHMARHAVSGGRGFIDGKVCTEYYQDAKYQPRQEPDQKFFHRVEKVGPKLEIYIKYRSRLTHIIKRCWLPVVVAGIPFCFFNHRVARSYAECHGVISEAV